MNPSSDTGGERSCRRQQDRGLPRCRDWLRQSKGGVSPCQFPCRGWSCEHCPPEEWAVHRHLRLSALRTNPEAFGATLHSQEQVDEQVWRRGTNAHAWFGFVDSQPAGMVRLWFDPQTKPTPEIIALWVDDRYRGHGVGRHLMLAAMDAARTAAGCAELWVVTSNVVARRLYESLGFQETSQVEVLPDGRQEIRMRWNA